MKNDTTTPFCGNATGSSPSHGFPVATSRLKTDIPMKTIILSIGLLTMSMASHAQSSVTLSGSIDAGVTRSIGSVASRTQLTSGGDATSKLAFRGREDLGGGMFAGFWLEGALASDSGVGSTTNTNNQPTGTVGGGGLTFNRRSILMLGGPWGTLHLGRDWSPTYDAFTGRYDVLDGAARGIHYQASFNSQHVRASNAIVYITPRVFGGLSANIQHWRGENASNAANPKDGTGHGIRFNYDNGPISAVAHYARVALASGDAHYRAVAGFYDFGAFRVAVTRNHDQQGTLRQDGWNVGGIWRVGAGELKASVSRIQMNSSGNPEGTKLAVGYIHHLSKRTAAYAQYGRIRNANGATFAIPGAVTGPNQSSQGMDIGLRHHF